VADHLLSGHDDASLLQVFEHLCAARPELLARHVSSASALRPQLVEQLNSEYDALGKDAGVEPSSDNAEPAAEPIGNELDPTARERAAQNWRRIALGLQTYKASPLQMAVEAAEIDEQQESPTILQFSASIFYCQEHEGVMNVEVVRLGGRSGTCSVEFTTSDFSALAGQKYQATSGVLTFGPNELTKNIEVKLLASNQWDATLEFLVNLSNAQNSSLGRYLYQCRVRIIDDDSFPTNRFSALCKKCKFQEIPKVPLLVEYFRMNYQRKDVRRCINVHMFVDQMDNLVKILFYVVQLYLVDYVLVDREASETTQTIRLATVGALLLLPHIALFFFDKLRTEQRLHGKCREILQINLLRKFLNYDATVRESLKESDVILTVTHDCPDLVEKGMFSVLGLVKEITLLVMLFLYQVVACSQEEDELGSLYTAAVPALAFPICLLVWLRIRLSRTVDAHTQVNAELERLAGCVESIVENFKLISGYNCRPMMIQKSRETIQFFCAASQHAARIDLVNQYFGPILMNLFIGLYIVAAGQLHLAGKMTTGQFVTNLAVLHQMAASWHVIHEKLLVVEVSLPALESVTAYLNMPLDLEHRRLLNRQRREENTKEREKVIQVIESMAGAGSALFSIDFIPLKIANASFRYGTGRYRRPSKSMFDVSNDQLDYQTGTEFGLWSTAVHQGTLTAMVGARGGGKTTLLKILGGSLLPTSGDFFTPPHLRVFYVTQEPMFFRMSMLANLTFGLPDGDPDASVDRVLSICRRLGVDKRILKIIEESRTADWRNVLSLTERVQLNLARALIANPEILILEKPTLAFDTKQATEVLENLRRFVDRRGLDFSDAGLAQRLMRRPRTCIFTASRLHGCTVADEIYEVTQTCVKRISKADVQESMLR